MLAIKVSLLAIFFIAPFLPDTDEAAVSKLF